jgi:hypothetical protein
MLKISKSETQTPNQNLQTLLIIQHINAKPEKVKLPISSKVRPQLKFRKYFRHTIGALPYYYGI